MQNHPDIDALTALSYGFMDDELARLKEHAVGCAECRKTLAEIAQERKMVASCLAESPLSGDVRARIRRKMDHETPLMGRRIVRWAASVAAALLIGYAAVTLFSLREEKTPASKIPAGNGVAAHSPIDSSRKVTPPIDVKQPVAPSPKVVEQPGTPTPDPVIDEKGVAARLKAEYERLLAASRERERALEETIARLNEELKTAQSPVALLREQQAKIEEMSRMVDAVKLRVDQVSGFKMEIDRLQEESRRLDEERGALLEQYRLLLAESEKRVKALDGEIAAQNADRVGASDAGRIAELEKTIAGLKDERDRVARRCETSRDEVRRYELVCAEIEHSRAAVRAQVSVFVGVGGSQDHSGASLWALKSAVDGYKSRVEELKKEHARMKEALNRGS